jgi:hypothetical protein
MLSTPDGDKALELVKEGVLGGVSLEARPMKNTKTREGVVQRVKANLRAVALTRFPAYDGARVLAVREEAVTLEEEFLFPEMDVGLVERCRQAGVKLPQRYEAHPDEDTPAQTGTSDVDTRHPENTNDSEVRP